MPYQFATTKQIYDILKPEEILDFDYENLSFLPNNYKKIKDYEINRKE